MRVLGGEGSLGIGPRWCWLFASDGFFGCLVVVYRVDVVVIHPRWSVRDGASKFSHPGGGIYLGTASLVFPP